MAANELFARGEQITLPAPIAANAGVGPISGDPLLFGTLPIVAETSYTPPGTREPTGNIGVKFIGIFLLSVTAKSSLSPDVGVTIAPGDPIYADGGTKDATTGMTYGFTLDGDDSGVLFGVAVTGLASGTTGTVAVKLSGVGAAL